MRVCSGKPLFWRAAMTGVTSSITAERLPRRPLRRVPRRRLPGGTRRARRRVLHARRVERRAPAALVVLRELKIEALSVHPAGDAPDPGPRVEPGVQRRE